MEVESYRSQLFWHNDQHCLVGVFPGRYMNSHRFCDLVKDRIVVTGQWQSKKVAPLVVLHLLSNGFGPTFRLCAEKGGENVANNSNLEGLRSLHKECMDDDRALVVAMGEDTEILLAPVNADKGGNGGLPCFWGYALIRGALPMGSELLDTGKVQVVFDLDETLVLAHTSFSLDARINQLMQDIPEMKTKVDECKDPAERHSLEGRLKAAEHEKQGMERDLELLKNFMEHKSFVTNGEMMYARDEPAEMDDGDIVYRPVIRLPGGCIFTRINPDRQETSMLIRIRPGWEDLRKYLTGESLTEKKQRFRVSVCTAADRDYALEAWRLLDVTRELIPSDERGSRIICMGKQKKSLFRALHLGPWCLSETPGNGMYSGQNILPLAEGASEMPLAIVVDDRTDVWDPRNHEQIIKIRPFLFYRDSFSSQKVPTPNDTTEIQRVMNVFQTARSELYYELMEVLTPFVHDAMVKSLWNEEAERKLEEALERAVSIVRFLTQTTRQPAPPPIEPSPNSKKSDSELPDISLRPQDPREILKKKSKPEQAKSIPTKKTERITNEQPKFPVTTAQNGQQGSAKTVILGEITGGARSFELPQDPRRAWLNAQQSVANPKTSSAQLMPNYTQNGHEVGVEARLGTPQKRKYDQVDASGTTSKEMSMELKSEGVNGVSEIPVASGGNLTVQVPQTASLQLPGITTLSAKPQSSVPSVEVLVSNAVRASDMGTINVAVNQTQNQNRNQSQTPTQTGVFGNPGGVLIPIRPPMGQNVAGQQFPQGAGGVATAQPQQAHQGVSVQKIVPQIQQVAISGGVPVFQLPGQGFGSIGNFGVEGTGQIIQPGMAGARPINLINVDLNVVQNRVQPGISAAPPSVPILRPPLVKQPTPPPSDQTQNRPGVQNKPIASQPQTLRNALHVPISLPIPVASVLPVQNSQLSQINNNQGQNVRPPQVLQAPQFRLPHVQGIQGPIQHGGMIVQSLLPRAPGQMQLPQQIGVAPHQLGIPGAGLRPPSSFPQQQVQAPQVVLVRRQEHIQITAHPFANQHIASAQAPQVRNWAPAAIAPPSQRPPNNGQTGPHFFPVTASNPTQVVQQQHTVIQQPVAQLRPGMNVTEQHYRPQPRPGGFAPNVVCVRNIGQGNAAGQSAVRPKQVVPTRIMEHPVHAVVANVDGAAARVVTSSQNVGGVLGRNQGEPSSNNQAPRPALPPKPHIMEGSNLLATGQGEMNPVCQLNQLAQKEKAQLGFDVRAEAGGIWATSVTWNGELVGRAESRNKKDGKRVAALTALKHLGIISPREFEKRCIVDGSVQEGGGVHDAGEDGDVWNGGRANSYQLLEMKYPSRVSYIDHGELAGYVDKPRQYRAEIIIQEENGGQMKSEGVGPSKRQAKLLAASKLLKHRQKYSQDSESNQLKHPPHQRQHSHGPRMGPPPAKRHRLGDYPASAKGSSSQGFGNAGVMRYGGQDRNSKSNMSGYYAQVEDELEDDQDDDEKEEGEILE